jgi:hypothetical protein
MKALALIFVTALVSPTLYAGDWDCDIYNGSTHVATKEVKGLRKGFMARVYDQDGSAVVLEEAPRNSGVISAFQTTPSPDGPSELTHFVGSHAGTDFNLTASIDKTTVNCHRPTPVK